MSFWFSCPVPNVEFLKNTIIKWWWINLQYFALVAMLMIIQELILSSRYCLSSNIKMQWSYSSIVSTFLDTWDLYTAVLFHMYKNILCYVKCRKIERLLLPIVFLVQCSVNNQALNDRSKICLHIKKATTKSNCFLFSNSYLSCFLFFVQWSDPHRFIWFSSCPFSQY